MSEHEFDERKWVKNGARRAETSVDPAMDERTAFAYGFMHGAREVHDALAKRLREAEAALSDYVADKGLSHKAQSYYAKYDGDEYFNKGRNK